MDCFKEGLKDILEDENILKVNKFMIIEFDDKYVQFAIFLCICLDYSIIKHVC